MINRPGARPERDGYSAGSFDVLVLDAALKQSLASVRSLARAGLRVAAAESVAQFDPGLPPTTFLSRYCLRAVVLPDLIRDEPGFIAAIYDFVRRYSPRVVLPTGDATIGVLRKYRGKLAELGCVLAIAPPGPPGRQ